MKAKKNQISVSVGIPAYNEAENIEFLLRSITNQNQDSFRLEKIYVVSDGSTDQTEEKVLQFAEQFTNVCLIKGTRRIGKKKRLIQLYQINKSDILVVCDGDVILRETNVLKKMVEYFKDERVVLVGGNNQPVEATNFTEEILSAWERVWYEVRTNINNGDSVHNIRGCILALRRSFANGVNFPPGIISEAQYLYFLCLKLGLKFRFAKEAVVLYRIPNNMRDYLLQKNRTINGRQEFAAIFGKWTYDLYKVPASNKIKGLLKMLALHPLSTILGGVLFFVSKYLPDKFDYLGHQDLWEIAQSTKRVSQI